jgi:hypothetical protein
MKADVVIIILLSMTRLVQIQKDYDDFFFIELIARLRKITTYIAMLFVIHAVINLTNIKR